MSDEANAWTKRMFSSPGSPKTTETPSFSRHLTISSAALLLRHLPWSTRVAGGTPDAVQLPRRTKIKEASVSIATINPATGETVKTFTPATDDEVEAAIARAPERFLDYPQSTQLRQRP